VGKAAFLKRIVATAVLATAVTACIDAARARTIEETVEVPVQVAGVDGTPISQSIKVTIFRDDAKARSPFLILNHGRPASRDGYLDVRAASYADNARYFVTKGFAVFLPIRVGYGATGGPDVEYSGPCRSRNFPPVYEAAARQGSRVIEYAKTLPYVDATKGIVVGQSFGGATAIALAAKNIPGVVAAVNFAGGGGGNPRQRPARPCRDDLLAQLFASYGATARIPTLWLYSENDQYWGREIPRTWFQGFVAKGGSGRFVQLPPYKDDGHRSFTGNPTAWRPAFEDFLRSCCAAAAGARPLIKPLRRRARPPQPCRRRERPPFRLRLL
jgi:dienelactone hydrolase